MTNNDPQRVVTGEVRLSYTHVFTPHTKPSRPGSPPPKAKYGVTILLPKSDLATKQRIDMAINATIQAGISSWNGIRPPVLNIPVHDGDGPRPSDGMPFPDECKGHWVFTAASDFAPQVVDAALNPIINQSEVYSGMYGRVSVRFFPYNNNGKKGVGCGLNNVQKLRDGEPLSGRTNAADDFGDGAGGYSPAAPAYPQPQQGYQQPAPYAPPTQPMYPQQGYTQPVQPVQPTYPQPVPPAYPQQPVQIDPITGAPLPPGGVMGI